jgi:hypothetical protein
MLRALAHAKRGWSKFHPIVLWLVGIKVHDDVLPNMMMWRELETAAADHEDSAGHRGCHLESCVTRERKQAGREGRQRRPVHVI